MKDHDTDLSLKQHATSRTVAATVTPSAKSFVMNSCHSRRQDVPHLSRVANSNVLHKLLKRVRTYEDAMVPVPGATIISKLLKRNMSKRDVSGGQQETTESEAPQEDPFSSPSQDSPQECVPLFGATSLCQFDSERLNDEHLWAKRARVENIIRGMSHSPNVVKPSIPSGKDHEQDGETDVLLQSSSPRDSNHESKRKQKVPQQQQQQSFQQLVSAHEEQKIEERRQLKLQLEDMQKQLRQLQEKFLQMYESTDSEADGGNISEGSTPSDEGGETDLQLVHHWGDSSDSKRADLDPGQFLDHTSDLDSLTASDKAKCSLKGKDFISMHEEGKRLAETLKQELNSAMSQVVETVVKVFSKPLQPLLEVFPSLPPTQDCFSGNGDNPNLHTANQRLRSVDDVIIPSPLDSIGGVPSPNGNNQTEALSLVVRKSTSRHQQPSAHRAHGGHPHPSLHTSHPALHTSHPSLHTLSLSANADFSPQSFRHPFSLPLIGYSFHSALAAPSTEYSSKDQRSTDSMDQNTSIQTTKPSVQHGSWSAGPSGSPAGGLSPSLLKSEFGDGVSETLSYPGNAIQDGLSPNHLKKAKLMFFYTRYPSSNVLKMFFSDVKFNRCITAQLIKWFSNFREFFYSQIEKFARQAVSDGAQTAHDITVTADSELYRVLNTHYNKSNEFQVPERFLEVAQITLREFFNAVVSGKDVDPSWKKAIYKVICKLDSDVPEIFKSKKCLWKL